MNSITKEILGRAFCVFGGAFEEKIVIVSTGRSGSTLLFEAVNASYVREKTNVFGRMFAKLAQVTFLARLSDLGKSTAPVVKSHDIFPENGYSKTKYIFVHGDPLESLLSVERVVQKEGFWWFQEHQKNLRAFGQYEDRYTQDVLNFRGQLLSWAGEVRENVLVLAYEDLWDSVEKISNFVGFRVSLPKKRDRTPKVAPANVSLELFRELASARFEILKEREIKCDLPRDFSSRWD